jgi:pSer/pThr/pTyr-binding forkhead associated (FHA) protein
MTPLLALLLAFFAFSAESFGQEPSASAEPWGYVYAVRTLHTYPLVEKDNAVGRLSENQIVLTSARVSRRHGVIRQTDEGAEYVDVGSSNGSRVNGAETRARIPVRLEVGDRIQAADELLLFHTSLDGLWSAELRMRLLSNLVELNVDLPQDFSRKSLGREEIVAVSNEATVNPDAGTVELAHSVAIEPGLGFGKGTAAFVGNVILDDGILELSLWAVEGAGSMTSRRASISRLKHTTLKIAMTNNESEPLLGPWFSAQYLTSLFDVFPEAREVSLRFATSLASQTRPVALRDASEVLAFRHHLSGDDDWKLLTLSARAGGAWVDNEIQERRMSLTAIERNVLTRALEVSRGRLERARALGAEGESVADAASAIARGESRLEALDAR